MRIEFGLILIPLLVVVSGIIAFIGNLVGRNIGRQRLSLLGLRPRHTAQIITILTGVLITILTLGVVLVLSQDARVALFRMNMLREETARLEAEIKQQESRLRLMRLGDIAYLTNQEVLRTVVDGRYPLPAVERQVDLFRQRAIEVAAANGISPEATSGEVIRLFPPGTRWDKVAEVINYHGVEMVLRLVAVENTPRGMPLVATLIWFENKLVFRKGTVLVQGTVDGRGPREAVIESVLRLVDAASGGARGKVISPPFGPIGAGPDVRADYDMLRTRMEQIQTLRRPVKVIVRALADTYAVGPLVLDLEVVR
ncbi:MAG: DUF3084 domain-containing protein [Armatimonadetes bacterium]|nr:DUF3084 domain-containing protein [Armatimonadota bacterium]